MRYGIITGKQRRNPMDRRDRHNMVRLRKQMKGFMTASFYRFSSENLAMNRKEFDNFMEHLFLYGWAITEEKFNDWDTCTKLPNNE